MFGRKKALAVREIFSRQTQDGLEYGKAIHAVDRATGCKLSYSFTPHNGGFLNVESPKLDDSVLIGVDGDEINKMATLICDGIKQQLG